MSNQMSDTEISESFNKDYEISPQTLRAAWSFVVLVDCPKGGCKNWKSFFSRIFVRLEVEAGEETPETLIKFLEASSYQLFPDFTRAVKQANGAVSGRLL